MAQLKNKQKSYQPATTTAGILMNVGCLCTYLHVGPFVWSGHSVLCPGQGMGVPF